MAYCYGTKHYGSLKFVLLSQTCISLQVDDGFHLMCWTQYPRAKKMHHGCTKARNGDLRTTIRISEAFEAALTSQNRSKSAKHANLHLFERKRSAVSSNAWGQRSHMFEKEENSPFRPVFKGENSSQERTPHFFLPPCEFC